MQGQMEKKYFYIASSPSYGDHPVIKIGISDNPWARVKSLSVVGFFFDLRAVFKFENTQYPIILECDALSNFYKKQYLLGFIDTKTGYVKTRRKGREYFSGIPNEFIAFVEKQIRKNNEKYERVL